MRKIIFFLGLFSASLTAAELPMVIDPVVNATPPGAKVSAGYFTIMNETDKDITIDGVYSPTIAKVEMHLSSVKDDVATMAMQETVKIEAGGKLEFTHGSYHLMLLELSDALKDGDVVDIILTTNIGDMLIEMPVKKLGTHSNEHATGDMEKVEQADMKEDESINQGEQAEMEKDENSSDHSDMKKDGAAHTEKTKNVN